MTHKLLSLVMALFLLTVSLVFCEGFAPVVVNSLGVSTDAGTAYADDWDVDDDDDDDDGDWDDDEDDDDDDDWDDDDDDRRRGWRRY